MRRPGPTEITFVANPKYASLARKTQAAAVLVEPEFPEIEAATLRMKNPYLAFSRALGLFYQPPAYAPGIHPTAVIDPTAEIGEGAHIGAYVVIGPSVKLGAQATLLPHVVLYPGVEVGQPFLCPRPRRRARTLHSGRRCDAGKRRRSIGADGFGFAKNEQGHWEKIPQSGPVRIGNRVDVQANATIDRATVGETRHRRRHQGGQSGPDRPRLARRRKHADLRADRAGRLLGHRQQRDSRRSDRHRRPLHGGRRRDSDRAIGGLARRAAGQR